MVEASCRDAFKEKLNIEIKHVQVGWEEEKLKKPHVKNGLSLIYLKHVALLPHYKHRILPTCNNLAAVHTKAIFWLLELQKIKELMLWITTYQTALVEKQGEHFRLMTFHYLPEMFTLSFSLSLLMLPNLLMHPAYSVLIASYLCLLSLQKINIENL